MILSPEDARLFFALHAKLMQFVNQRLNVVPDVDSPQQFAQLSPEDRVKVRDAFVNQMSLIESFVEQNPYDLNASELEIILGWKHSVVGKFFLFRQLKKHMVFLSSDTPTIAYGVVALTQSFHEVSGSRLPLLQETMLMPFRGQIVYDGLLTGHNISFGGGIKQMLADGYRDAKERIGIVTSLLFDSRATQHSPNTKSRTTTFRNSAKTQSSAATGHSKALDNIKALAEQFCLEHLNSEYSHLCGELADQLSRKRPSPLLRGQPKSWASGIIRTIGYVNFLDDPDSLPYLKMTEIDRGLGVSTSTGQSKSREIRKLLNIGQLDVQWTLPSAMDDNPLVWTVELDNGLVIDLRTAPRELQEAAFQQGIIPYIPTTEDSSPMPEGRLPTDRIFQFKITLLDSEPKIWRRIQVPDDSLDELHEHIQTAMGWTNSHLHQFDINGRVYGDPDLLHDGFEEFNLVDSTATLISDVVPEDGKRFRMVYEYDFGDGWQHELLFEGNPTPDPNQAYPVCLEGERACPPEDVGGVWGYQDFVKAIVDPLHDQHEELLQWGGSFDPEHFDATETTTLMQEGLLAWDRTRTY